MNERPATAEHPAFSWRLRVAAIVLVPLAVFAAFALAYVAGPLGPLGVEDAEYRAERIARWFDRSTRDALSLTSAMLPGGSPVEAAIAASPIARRQEGAGILDSESNYLGWEGMPPEPPGLDLGAGAPVWQVRLDGVHTRLLVRAGPDAEGRTALAGFVVDSRLESAAFERMLPASLRVGIDLEVRFLDSAAWQADTVQPDAPPEDGAVRVLLRAPDGAPLAEATVAPLPPQPVARRALGMACAAAVACAVLLLALLLPWPALARGSTGMLVAIGTVLVVRLAFAVVRAPTWLLPKSLGSASQFGTPAFLGLAASPADLLLSALALLLVALALRRRLLTLGATRPRVAALAAGGAALTAAGGVTLTLSLIARHASPQALEHSAAYPFDASALLTLALVAAMIGVAELIGVAVALGLRRRGSIHALQRVAIVLALIVSAIAGGLRLQQLAEREALERLRSEFAPLVLDQSARRTLALTAALDRVRRAFAASPRGGAPPSSDPDFLAYHLWVTSELFFSGFMSSLDFYTPAGELASRFGFDVRIDEEPPTAELAATSPRVFEETVGPVSSVQRRVLHVESILGDPTRPLGTVIGHVLDEPENLPFLPAVQPYLAALGPGAELRAGGIVPGDLQYTLYDAPGTVLLSTLRRPPAMTDVLLQAFAADETVRLSAGEDRFVGIALQDDYHRLHLLLLPARDVLQRLAAAVRLTLLALAAWVAMALLPHVLRPAAWRRLVRSIRGSFYRKLLVALLLASMVPLIGLALFLRGYVEDRGHAALVNSATQYVAAAQRVLNDYTASQMENDIESGAALNDNIVSWLRNVVGQEIHVYENGLLRATSKRELFTSGLLPLRLDGEVHRRLGREGLPSLVVESRLGPRRVPVAYAPVQSFDPLRERVVAVPVLVEGQTIARAIYRVNEMILLSTVLLVALLTVVAAFLARTVARPVRELVGATGRIAAGDYSARLDARTHDEVAELVHGFNSMAGSLAAQRRDLERRRDYMERLLQHATTGVVSTDPAGRVVTLNPAARKLLTSAGRAPRIGERLSDELARSVELAPLGALLRGDPAAASDPEEVDLERAGEPRRLRLVRIELPDPQGGTVGRLVLLDDVTDLMKSNQLAAWAEMARVIAHEIKNPLTPIQLSAEHLERLLHDRGVLPSPEIEACLETVKKQVRNLHEIAGEFSAYAKLPALQRRPLDAAAFLRETGAPYRAAPPPGVEVVERIEPCGSASIDTRVLGRALVNLIENALQAMPDGGTLELGASRAPESDDVLLWVRDTGVGLLPEVRRRLFEPYFSTKSSGTGLGLAIVRRAVEAHGGRIEVESLPGSGTTFRIRLPAGPAN